MTKDHPIRSQPDIGLAPQGRVLEYRSRRADGDAARRRSARRARRRQRRRPSTAGRVAMAAAVILALCSTVSFAMAVSHELGRGLGPAGTVCVTFPLSYVAIMCGVVGVLPRGQNQLLGWCALATTAASWALYAVSFALAAAPR